MTFRWMAPPLCAGLLGAQTGVGLPRIGCFRDGDAVRHVFGIAGTFVVSGREGKGVRWVACWGNRIAVKTDDGVEFRDLGTGRISRRPASTGPAVFSHPPTEHYPAPRGRGESAEPDIPENEGGSGLELAAPGAGLISAAGRSVVVRDSGGTERSIELPAPAAFIEWLGEAWVRVVLAEGRGHLALRVGCESLKLYRLPDVGP
jgi:hypothetical protein